MTRQPFRGLSVIAAVALLALTGCVSTAELESETSPTPTRTVDRPPAEPASCTRERSVDLPVANSTDGLPGVDEVASMEWTPAGYERGEGACAPEGTSESATTVCSPVIGDSPALSAPLDDMFAAGALRQTSARVRVDMTTGAEFAYAASTWRFPSAADAAAAPFVGLIAACDDVVTSTDDDRRRWELYDGDEPHLRLTVDGADVLLFRSLSVAAEGEEGEIIGLPSTRSGLLSLAAVDDLEEWWLSNTAPDEP